MAQLAPVPSLLVLCLVFSNKKSVTKWKYSLEEVIQGPVASDHGWLVTSFRPGRFGGEMPGFEAIRGQEPYTAHFQHPAIFWHFCGNFRMSRGAFRNYWVEAGTKNKISTYFVLDQKNVQKIEYYVLMQESGWFHFQQVRVCMLDVKNWTTKKQNQRKNQTRKNGIDRVGDIAKEILRFY